MLRIESLSNLVFNHVLLCADNICIDSSNRQHSNEGVSVISENFVQPSVAEATSRCY